MSKGFEEYTKTYGFKDVQDKLDVCGIWHVRGEDPNCDFGGSHVQPTLGFFAGRLRDVIEYAVTLKDFWQWGAGGSFEQVNVVKVDDQTAQRMQALKEEKEQLEKRLAELNRIVK